MAHTNYIHKQLNATSQQIRLCKFTRDQAGLIACTLKEVDIDSQSCPPFRALSYEWGPPSPLETIMVDGFPFEIRQNLLLYLEQAECFHQWDTPWIFIDQVSIDQANTLERSHQVQMMGTIFSRAEVVIAWIDPSDKDSDIVVNAMYIRSLNEKLLSQKDSRPMPDMIEQTMPSELTLEENAGWVAFSRQRSYFSRLWVVQEMLLARAVLIACGSARPFPWQALRVLDWLPRSRDAEYTSSATWTHLERLSHYGDRSYKGLSLLTVLHAYAGHKCTDPRDKVYGLQGLVMESERVRIDYSRSVSDIYVDTALALAKSTPTRDLPDALRILIMSMGIGRRNINLECSDERLDEYAKHIYSTDVDIEYAQPGYQQRHQYLKGMLMKLFPGQ